MAKQEKTEVQLRCSFFGKGREEVRKLIAGPTVYICDECVDLCNDIIAEDLEEKQETVSSKLPKPKEIMRTLAQYVIGQERAKKGLSVAVHNHYKRISSNTLNDAEPQKGNVPPQGGRKHPHQEFIQVDTANILFVCGGAFVGLESIVEQRVNQKSIGFGAEIKGRHERRASHLLAQVQPEDLLKYGLIPEFVGRLPVAATLEELDEKSLIRILTEPKNALLKQYEKLLAFEKVKLKFTESAIVAVARKAFKQKTGARGLRSILEVVMLDVMYEIPSQREIRECVITEDVIEGKAAPLLIKDHEKGVKSA